MSDEWKASTPAGGGDDKSWKLLEKAVLAGVQEQRRSRRWGIFFKVLTFLYLFVALALFSPLSICRRLRREVRTTRRWSK